jgi:serine/threonine protein kinase
VLVSDDGEALITDFGRSRVLEVSKSTSAQGPIPDVAHGLLPLWPEEDPSELATYEWRWMAPELLDVQEDVVPLVTVATDIYSFAMTTIEVCIHYQCFLSCLSVLINDPQIITQRMPFWYILVDASVVVYVVSGGRPKRAAYRQINDDIWAMLEECWNAEPSHRPSMDTIISFFAKQLTSLNPERAHL